MVGKRIKVRSTELSESAAVVGDASDGVLDCGSRVRALSGTGSATGSASCAASFEAMVGLWSDQLTMSAEEVDAVSRATEEARGGYEANESGIGGMFRAGGRP